jgi:hypothetical protein
MANTKISDFTSGAPAQATDELVIARSGSNFKLTNDDVRSLVVGTANTFTATQTFDPADNTSAIIGSGYSLTGSASASFVDLAGTWNTSGTPTAIKLNITNTASTNGLLMDLQSGSISRFAVRAGNDIGVNGIYGGAAGAAAFSFCRFFLSNVNSNGVLWLSSGGQVAFANSADVSNSPTMDTILTRRAAANLRLGAADAVDATQPIAQTLSVQSAVAGASATNVSISGTALTVAGTITGTIRVGQKIGRAHV